MAQSKFCIVTTRNIFDSPNLTKYRDLLDEPFDILYWDRVGIEEDCGAAGVLQYRCVLAPDASVTDKLRGYLGYRRFAMKALRGAGYERLIIYPTQAARVLLPLLTGEYRGRYLLDVRDYAGENRGFFGKRTAKAVENSALTTVTSPAYARFLPERSYPVSHNVQPIDVDLVRAYRTRERDADAPLALSFIGTVRFLDRQKELIRTFASDERFVLRFIGRGSEQLADFCRDGGYDRVELLGRFDRSELGGFYAGTDMAINVYGSHDPYLDYALSNKLYSAAMMGMPILVSPDTYMAEIVSRYGFGLAIDPTDPAAPQKVYDYYTALDREALLAGCDAFLHVVAAEEESWRAAVKAALTGTEGGAGRGV